MEGDGWCVSRHHVPTAPDCHEVQVAVLRVEAGDLSVKMVAVLGYRPLRDYPAFERLTLKPSFLEKRWPRRKGQTMSTSP